MALPLWLPVVGPIIVAAIGYYLPRGPLQRLSLLFQLGQTALVSYLLVLVRRGGPIRQVLGGWPGGIGIPLDVDVVSGALVALSGWFFLLLLLFNVRKRYMDRLFQFLLWTLQGLLVGLFLAADLFNMYVLLELSTLVISVLIMYKRSKQAIFNGMVYLTVNLASMSFMLLGIGLVYRGLGTLDLQQMAVSVAAVGDPRSLILPFAFVITAIGVKAAMFLLFAWLPPAHGAPSAPSIVSAILSGLQVKAGVYLFIRLQGVFGEALPTREFFLIVGILTAVSGFVLAIAQKDIKLILAYHTISQVGLIILGLNVGTDTAWWGGIYHMINHAIFKALLFLTAGIAIHVYGTRNVYQIRGLFRRMPLVALGALAGVLGITGAPYFNGSVSKYLIQSGWQMSLGEAAIHLINLGTAVSFVKFSTIFFGRPNEGAGPVQESRQPDGFTTTVALIMGTVCFAGGIGAPVVLRLLFGRALKVSGAFVLEKLITFAITVGVAIAIYQLIVKRTAIFDRIRAFHFSLNDLVVGILLFFGSTAGYLYVVL